MPDEVTVRYKYPDDTGWSEIVVPGSTASATTEQVEIPGACPDTYDVVWTKDNKLLSSQQCVGDGATYTNRLLGPIGGIRDTCNVFNNWVTEIILLKADRSGVRKYEVVAGSCKCTSSAPNSRIINLIRITNGSNDCGPTQCKFTVLDENGVQVFSRTDDDCPIWEIVGSCPEGTLDCGDCCLPCDETAAELRSLVSHLKQLAGSPVIHR